MRDLTVSLAQTVLISLLIGGGYLYVYYHERSRSILLWAAGWIFYAFRLCVTLFLPDFRDTVPVAMLLHISGVCSCVLILEGTQTFCRRKARPLSNWGVGAAAVFAGGILTGLGLPFAADIVVFSVLCGFQIWTGLLFILDERQERMGQILGVLFFLWGLHKLDYPFLRSSGDGYALRFFISSVLVLAIGINILMFHYEQGKEVREELLERYERLFHDNHSMMMLIDPESGRIKEVNEAAVLFYGFPEEVLLDMTVLQLNTLPAEKVLSAMDEAVQTGKRTYLFQHRLAGGEIRDVQITSGPIRFGQTTLLYSIIQDMSDVKQREQFHMLERELSLSGSHATDYTDYLEQSLRILEAFEGVDGCGIYLSEEGTGTLVTVHAASGDQEIRAILESDIFLRMMSDRLRAGDPLYEPDLQDAEAKGATGWGPRLHTLLVEPILQGEMPQGLLAIVSERRNAFSDTAREHYEFASYQIGGTLYRLDAEKKRSESDDRWQFALEGNGDVVLEFDENWQTTYISETTQDIIGGSVPETSALLQHWENLVHPEDLPAVKEVLQAYMAGLIDHYAVEHRVKNRLGEERWFLHRGRGIARGRNGRITRTLATLTDITNLKEYEREVLAAKAELERANGIKSLFLANISHELRTPMNGILGMLQLIELSELDADQKESLQIMKDSSRRMMTLINNLITYTSIEAGELLRYDQRFNLEEMVEECIAMVQFDVKSKGLSLRTDSDRKVGNVVGDREKLAMVLSQLLDNAIKFTDSGSIRLSVRTHTVTADGQSDPGRLRICFSVSDTGIGIGKEDLARIFTNFTQVDNSYTRLYQGTGLGLAICRKVKELLDADFRVESSPGQGSTFTFEVILTAPQTGKGEVLHGGLIGRVLVVDDDEVSRRLLGIFCEKGDLQVHYAANAREAIALNDAYDFDIIFMDIQMPEMSGLEAAKIINGNNGQREKAARIVAVTAYALKGDRERFLQEGMHDYVAKPIDNTKLQQVIRKWLSREDSPARK